MDSLSQNIPQGKLHPQLCLCGCGNLTSGKWNHHTQQYAQFILGHHTRLETVKKASAEGRRKGVEVGNYKKSEEWKKQASVNKIGERNPNYGQGERMRQQALRHPRKGKLNYFYGKVLPYGKVLSITDRQGRTIKMRSPWEVQFAHWLDAQGVTWDYEPKTFELGDHTYTPDFWVEEWQCYWEVKGWFHDRHQMKVRLFREMVSEYPLVVATKKVLRMLMGRRFEPDGN